MTTPPRPVDTSSAPATPGRILDAAAALFAERGYDAVSINAIAATVGISKANVFHHFRCKRELYLAVLRAACDEVTQGLADKPQQDQGFTHRLEGFVQRHLQHLHDHAGITRLVLRELLEDDVHRGEELAEQALGHGFTRLVRMVRDGQHAGLVRPEIDPAVAALVMLGANVFFFQARELLRHLPDVDFAEAPERYADLVARLLLEGMLVDNGRSRTQPGRR